MDGMEAITLAVMVGLLALGGFCCKMAFCRGVPMEIPAAMTDDGVLLTRERRRRKGGYRGDFNTEIESGEDLIESDLRRLFDVESDEADISQSTELDDLALMYKLRKELGDADFARIFEDPRVKGPNF